MGGSEDDFSAFVEARSEALFRTAYFLTGGDRHEAEDLLQDALVDSFARWDTIRDLGAREAFVRRILVRKATRRWRRPNRAEVIAADLPEKVHAGHEESVAATQDFATALARLSPRQRAVVVLRYYLDLSEADIAETLGCSTGAVKTHASRALRALGVALDETTSTNTPAPTVREGS